MRNKIVTFLAACLCMAAPLVTAQATYTAQAGVTFFVVQPATATATSGAVRLPTFNGAGTLTVIGSGITGSPSGCTIVLKYQSNAGGSATGAISTTSFTPATSTQQFTITPSVANGDNYIATYACSSTYPTAGTLSISFSPSSAAAGGAITVTNSGDPCANPNVAKSSVSVAISTATTTQIVAISGTKAVYVCGGTLVFGASTTAQFEYGTSTNCTGTNALTGVMSPGTGTTVGLSGDGTRFGAPASNGLCVVSTGTGGIEGYISYVQQ